MTIPRTATATADRARTLAAVLTHRADAHAARGTFLAVAAFLIDAAHSFETEEPPTLGGVTLTNTIPSDASMALLDADAVAEDDPHTTHVRDVIRYVLTPITRTVPELTPLRPVSAELADHERDLAARIASAAQRLDWASTTTLRYRILSDLMDLHHEHARLADAVTADNTRPRADH